VTAAHELPMRDFPRPDDIVELQVDALTGMLPGEFTTQTVTESFAAAHQPTQRDTLHRKLVVEAATGKIWQAGCGDPAVATPEPGASPGAQVPEEKLYLDLTDYEGAHPTWEEANRAWIESYRGRESDVRRSPSPAFDAPFAPTETCTPGEIPTSTPSPSPSPSPSPTPLPTPSPTPAPIPTPIVLPSEIPLPSPSLP
jgi:hypothetical protein